MGTDDLRRRRIAKLLPDAQPFPLGEELTRFAHEVQQPFSDWMAEIGLRQRNRPNWWASRMASKSPLQTDLFLLVCYGELLHRWAQQPRLSGHRLIVVEDPWLLEALRRQLAGTASVRFPFGDRFRLWREALRGFGKIPGVAAYTLAWCLTTFLPIRLFLRDRLPEREGAGGPVTLLYTWIEPRCFLADGAFRDPYTGRLAGLLSRGGQAVVRFTPLRLPFSCWRQLRRVHARFLASPRFLRFSDLLRSLTTPFTIRDLSTASRFHGRDYTWLLRREILREWSQPEFTFYLLWHRAMRRMARRWGRFTDRFIYPFENQPWEKLLCLAWQESAPQVRRIGYQHSWVPSLLLPYSLGKKESALAPLPDWIVTNSEYNLEQIRRGGYPVDRLLNGGALRHDYLHGPTSDGAGHSASLEDRRDPAQRLVLVPLPLSLPHSRNLVGDLLDGFREPLRVGTQNSRPVRFLLKCHPNLPWKKISAGRISLPAWIGLSQEPMDRILPTIDLLLYAGLTSTWWEAALKGIPIVKYQTDLLDIDAEQSVQDFQVVRCSRPTLRETVAALLQEPPVRKQPGAGMLHRMFGPVQDESWLTVGLTTAPLPVNAG